MTNDELTKLAARAEVEGKRLVEEAIQVALDPLATAPLLALAGAMFAVAGAAKSIADRA